MMEGPLTEMPSLDQANPDVQEWEAHNYALALLLPYAPLLQLVQHGISLEQIAHHYGISAKAVEMRLKVSGLWKMRHSLG